MYIYHSLHVIQCSVSYKITLSSAFILNTCTCIYITPCMLYSAAFLIKSHYLAHFFSLYITLFMHDLAHGFLQHFTLQIYYYIAHTLSSAILFIQVHSAEHPILLLYLILSSAMILIAHNTPLIYYPAPCFLQRSILVLYIIQHHASYNAQYSSYILSSTTLLIAHNTPLIYYLAQ